MWEASLTQQLLSEPVLLYAGKLSDNPNWSFSSHKHDDLSEIVYIREGEGIFVINGVTYNAKQGDVLIYNKGILHEERSIPTNPLKTYFCGVSGTQIEGLKKDWLIPGDIDPVIRSNKHSRKLEALMREVVEESYMKEAGYEVICKNLMISIIMIVQRMIGASHSRTPSVNVSLPVQIKDFIDTNFTNPLNLKGIADEFHINPYYLSHLYKEHYQTSPIHYMIERRMGEAKKLLVSTEMKVWEIARIVGYDNPNYFTMQFKKITGETPLEFKLNHKKKLYYP